jgi:Ca2+-binding EF-hand superfamily protein
MSVGSHDTNLYEDIYTTHRDVGKYQYEFSSLNLSEEDIGKLYTKFIVLDSNHNGSVDSKEFFHHFSISKSRFATRVFNFYDIDDSGNRNRNEREGIDRTIPKAYF